MGRRIDLGPFLRTLGIDVQQSAPSPEATVNAGRSIAQALITASVLGDHDAARAVLKSGLSRSEAVAAARTAATIAAGFLARYAALNDLDPLDLLREIFHAIDDHLEA